MSRDTPDLGKYFNRLTSVDKQQLEDRMERYRDQLEDQGYQVTTADGSQGFFAGVLVIDEENGRFGFLEENGSVAWITGNLDDVGGLGSAVLQKPTAELKQEVEGLENAEVE